MRSGEEPAAPGKADPETLALRGRPGRVVRFRRGAVIAIAALGSVAIAGTAWLALKPPTFRLVAEQEEQPRGATPSLDALAGAPRSYGEVPELGPPLPGDLGRPILAHQRELDSLSADPAAESARRAAEQAEADQRAAREAGVLVKLAGVVAPAVIASAPTLDPTQSAETAMSNEAVPDSNELWSRFDFPNGRGNPAGINPHALVPPGSPHMLSAGSVIAASLLTGLNSDLPGLVTAQVTQHAYDSQTGRILLIPQGSRLIGTYDSKVAYGQSRALLVWQRLIFPDGSSLTIDNIPASDTAGHAGLADRLDRHGWQLLKGVALSTLLGVGSELTLGESESELVRAIRESAQQNGARAGDKLVGRELDVQPTIRVRPGWPLRVVVNKDLVLPPWQSKDR